MEPRVETFIRLTDTGFHCQLSIGTGTRLVGCGLWYSPFHILVMVSLTGLALFLVLPPPFLWEVLRKELSIVTAYSGN